MIAGKILLDVMKTNPSQPPKYPFATIAAYGPDNKLATKLVVGIIKQPGKGPDDLHRWLTKGGDVRNDPVIAAEVVELLKRNGVTQTTSYDRILGCPHEEGIDYPDGSTCPQCPFWQNIDRFTQEPKSAGDGRQPAQPAPKVGRNDPCPCGSGKKYKKCCG
jgi:hypothetical protein